MKQILLAHIALLLVAGCGSEPKATNIIPSSEVIPVKIQALETIQSKDSVSVSGQFTTDDETFLSFLSGGVIQKIYVREGDKVRKGQLLATLDLTLAKATVSQAQLALEKAKRDLERVKNLQKEGYATLEQAQNAQTAYDVALEQLQSAQFNLKYSEIRAVSDGFILRKMANPGQLVGSGTPVFQTNGAGSKQFKLKVGVSDRQWSQIQLGDKAWITTDLFGDKAILAHVSRKAESVDPYSGTFAVELELDEQAPVGLASGVFGKATILLSKVSKNWKIPYEALLDGNGEEGFVFVTDDKKNVRKVSVTIAQLGKDVIEISQGLEQVKYVIVSGSPYLNEQSRIQVK